jgi:hypothetical protein
MIANIKSIGIILFCLSNFLKPDFLSSQWSYQSTVQGLGSYPSISVYSPNGLITAGGPNGIPKVLKSTNGGVNWIDISGNLNGPELYCVWAVNENLIFAGDGGANGGTGGNAKLWKTTNGGLYWSVVLTTGGTFGCFNGIVFSRTNPLFGIAQSDPPTSSGNHFLTRTIDGGNTWNLQDVITSGSFACGNSVFCYDSLLYGWGLSVTSTPRIMFTTNGGVNWNISETNFSGNSYITGAMFIAGKNLGFAASNSHLPSLSRTTNGGLNWIPYNTGIFVSSLNFCRLKWVNGTNVCYLTSETGINGCIGKSTNEGLNWSAMTTNSIMNIINMDLIYTGGNVYAYAINPDGDVIRVQDPVVNIENSINNVPTQYYLHQNYPNPFNPVTTITFQIPSREGWQPKADGVGFVTLKVFDVRGREVETLVNENLAPGSYSIIFDASKYPSGVYFYKLSVKDMILSKRMILLK